MRTVVGIDLGSTTTKAVILGEDGSVLGRGLTNTRSNYEVACEVALTEALLATRFGLVEAELGRAGLPEARRRALLHGLRRAFDREAYLHRLRDLARAAFACAEAGGLDGAAHAVLEGIFATMVGEAKALFAAEDAGSGFFRDLAGSRYLALAEEAARAGGPPFELLAGAYDKAILLVENAPPGEDLFATHARAALGKHADPALTAAVGRAAGTRFEEASSVGTGYGRSRLPFPKEHIRSEILCHGLGAHALFPGTRTVLDIGGQDTKAIQVDEHGIVTSFQMNDRCAAGCGRYLGYIADEMGLGLHELGPLAQTSRRPVRISSTCTVFAGAELRERLAMGERREDILAGLHRAIILRALALLARSGGVHEQFTFTGGVARNEAATGALRTLISENYGDVTMNVSPDSIYTGALGAALFALRDAAKGALRVPA